MESTAFRHIFERRMLSSSSSDEENLWALGGADSEGSGSLSNLQSADPASRVAVIDTSSPPVTRARGSSPALCDEFESPVPVLDSTWAPGSGSSQGNSSGNVGASKTRGAAPTVPPRSEALARSPKFLPEAPQKTAPSAVPRQPGGSQQRGAPSPLPRGLRNMGATSNSQATGCSSAVDLVGGVVVYLSWMSGGCRVIDFLARENEAFVSRGGQEGAGEPEGLSVKWLDMFRGDHQAKWFREISPRQKLPFLRVAKPASDNPEGGPNPTLSETNSIIKFLCSHYKGLEQWYPSDVMARASVDEILDFLLANVCAQVKTIVANCCFSFIASSRTSNHDVVLAGASLHLDESLGVIEQVWLSDGRNFLCGRAHASVADILLVSELESLSYLRPDFSSLPHLQSLRTRIRGMESFAGAHKEHDALMAILLPQPPVTL